MLGKKSNRVHALLMSCLIPYPQKTNIHTLNIEIFLFLGLEKDRSFTLSVFPTYDLVAFSFISYRSFVFNLRQNPLCPEKPLPGVHIPWSSWVLYFDLSFHLNLVVITGLNLPKHAWQNNTAEQKEKMVRRIRFVENKFIFTGNFDCFPVNFFTGSSVR